MPRGDDPAYPQIDVLPPGHWKTGPPPARGATIREYYIAHAPPMPEWYWRLFVTLPLEGSTPVAWNPDQTGELVAKVMKALAGWRNAYADAQLAANEEKTKETPR